MLDAGELVDRGAPCRNVRGGELRPRDGDPLLDR